MEQLSPIIDIRHLNTRFDNQIVHQQLSLMIPRQTISVLVGASGCGKSTLLREMIGLHKPDAGEIRVLGVDITRANEADFATVRARWGVMFQQGALFSGLTVKENIEFVLKRYSRLDKVLRAALAQQKCALCGLSSAALHKYPAELSGGMIKRAAVARAIAMDPELLFLDEPTAGLDPNGAAEMDELILTLKNALGLTVVMVSHDLDTMYHIADQIVYMGRQRVLLAAPIQTMLKNTEYPEITDYFHGARGQRYYNT